MIDENDIERRIFRFYPRRSHCHGFDDKPPKTWKGVYKVYYTYAIIYQSKYDDEDTEWDSMIIYDCASDECSCLGSVGKDCVNIAAGKKKIGRNKLSYGLDIKWEIEKKVSVEPNIESCYEFTLSNYFGQAGRFCINQSQMYDFGQYLMNCCEYMLAHSEGI